MSRLGIGPATHVVACDDAEGMFAARLWWALAYHGHRRASVLDGGWPRWVAEGRPVTAAVPAAVPAVFVPRPDPALRRTKTEVLAALGGSTAIVDVRGPAEFAGRVSRARRNGRIPGAVNVPAPISWAGTEPCARRKSCASASPAPASRRSPAAR